MRIAAGRRTGRPFDPTTIKSVKPRADRIRTTGAMAQSRGLKAILDHADAIEQGKPSISPGKARLRPKD